MASEKIVIIGGVAGGATAAARLRRLDENLQIVLFERGEYISFANCGLPYYIGGTIPKMESLLLQNAGHMAGRFNMDIRTFSEVVQINRTAKKVVVRNLRTNNIYEESYDKLILSPGAKPFIPPIPGLDQAQHVYTLRNIPDSERIKGHIRKNKPSQVTIIGAGFIGLEMAENLHDLNLKVSIVEQSRQVMEVLDYEMAAILQQHLREKDIQLFLSNGLQRIENNGKTLILNNGERIDTDMIILAVGVQPDSDLAKKSGIETGPRGHIKVNPYLQTSDPDIFAVGDAVEVNDFITGLPVAIPLAWPANRQGKLVADRIAGKSAPYRGTLGTAIAKVFDLTAATTGLTEKRLKKSGYTYKAVHVHPKSHAGYYPGSGQISLKLLFSPEDGKIYGAQAIGNKGVDKRIDVLATAIKSNLTVNDLADLELAYAPPYSSAKDPVNILGYAAQNVLESLTDSCQWAEVKKLQSQGAVLLDVRDPQEFESATIEGAMHIPLDLLRQKLNSLDKENLIIVFCQVGYRGYMAARILSQNGFNVKNLDGGFKTYSAAISECDYLNQDRFVADCSNY